MRDWRAGLQKKSMKYVVVAVAVANCAGIYLAQDRLNRPYTGPAAGEGTVRIDFADAAAMMDSFARESEVSLGIEAGPPPAALASSNFLPELAPLPAIKLEAPTVIPSVPAPRAARLGLSEPRAARFQPARQVDSGFDSAFTPDYAALAPYDGSAEAAGLSATAPDAAAMGAASEVQSDAIALDTLAEPGPFTATSGENTADAPVQELSVPAASELPAVELTAEAANPAG